MFRSAWSLAWPFCLSHQPTPHLQEFDLHPSTQNLPPSNFNPVLQRSWPGRTAQPLDWEHQGQVSPVHLSTNTHLLPCRYRTFHTIFC